MRNNAKFKVLFSGEFSAFEALAVIAAVTVAAFAIWWLWHRRQL
jgi:hypothetical protein